MVIGKKRKWLRRSLDKLEKSIQMCAVVDTFQNHRIKFVFLTGSCSVGTALVVN